MSAGLHGGQLLVAAPSLLDPNFTRAVVLLCEVSDDGAIGLILNRPSTEQAADYLPQWEPSEPAVVFVGGPVQPEIAVGLARRREQEPIGFSAVSDDLGLFDLATPSELVAGALADLRVFSGYAGWDGGQLQSELMAGDWILVDGTTDDCFTQEPESLWTHVLRRQGGETSLLADYPIDPTLN